MPTYGEAPGVKSGFFVVEACHLSCAVLLLDSDKFSPTLTHVLSNAKI